MAADGGYNAGLTYEAGHEPPNKKPLDSLADFYELLQVSPNADPDMIHRVFRLLAQRYHPDNTDTGDESTFRAITDAYKILSDPEKRAAYDVHLQSYRQQRWRIFDQKQASVGKLAEKAKRKGILELLYTTRRNQPTQPTLNLHELEDLLGCPREHLEFSLWYLKENGLVVRADNGRFAVTVKGVDWAEQQEVAEVANNRLLSSGDGNTPPVG
jgi:curved DNA-binding protein CbpA